MDEKNLNNEEKANGDKIPPGPQPQASGTAGVNAPQAAAAAESKQTDAPQAAAAAESKQTDAPQAAAAAESKQTDAPQAAAAAESKQMDAPQPAVKKVNLTISSDKERSKAPVTPEELELASIREKEHRPSGQREAQADPPAHATATASASPAHATATASASPTHAAAAPSSKKKKKRHKRHIWLYILGFLAALILLVYFGVAMYFKAHFLPNTILNGIDIGYLDAGEAESVLESIRRDGRLRVLDRDGNEAGVIVAGDVDMTIDARDGVEELLQSQDIYLWPNAFTGIQEESIAFRVDFDRDKLSGIAGGWDILQTENMKRPENAYISEYLPEKKGYEIIPDRPGSQLDWKKTLSALEEALASGETELNLSEAGCYIAAEITSQDVNLNKKLDTLNKWTGTRITYDWNGSETVLDGDTIQEWIVEENGRPALDEEKIAEFVKIQAKNNDTYGKKRKFTTTLGVELTLPSGAYGWKTDRAAEAEELKKLIESGSVTEREPVYSSQGARKGQEDIGTSYVEIDLSNQHLYLYEKGEIVLETDFVSGDMTIPGRVTPPGVFGLTYKTTNAVLRGEDYETPVNYWMPFNGNVGMHDATWRRSFGGTIYITNGSHGCVNLPLKMAKQIYGYMSTGFPIICYYY